MLHPFFVPDRSGPRTTCIAKKYKQNACLSQRNHARDYSLYGAGWAEDRAPSQPLGIRTVTRGLRRSVSWWRRYVRGRMPTGGATVAILPHNGQSSCEHEQQQWSNCCRWSGPAQRQLTQRLLTFITPPLEAAPRCLRALGRFTCASLAHAEVASARPSIQLEINCGVTICSVGWLYVPSKHPSRNG